MNSQGKLHKSNRPIKVMHIVGARPNFMKISPLMREMSRYPQKFDQLLLHTGQHYDDEMSKCFFNDLGLTEPDIYLGVGSGTHSEQTGKIMIEFEKVCIKEKPDLVIVVGDVNSTIACALVAAKLCIPVAHIEAGLRSFDRTMPEEINRILTDQISDYLFTTCEDANQNLIKEGIPSEKIHRVGNIMIDSLEMLRGRIEQEQTFSSLGFKSGGYGVVTLHRPANVDPQDMLKRICLSLKDITKKIPLVFPVHPRTMKNIEKHGYLSLLNDSPNLRFLEPLSYIPFMNLVFNSRLIITDSGGIQEETTYLGIPCLTLRENTERPITITQGTNRLCNVNNLLENINDIIGENCSKLKVPELWDGHTAERVAQSIQNFLKV